MGSLSTPRTSPQTASFAQKTLALMVEMIALLDVENPLLEKRDFSRLADITRRKEQLHFEYQTALRSLAESAHLRASLTSAERTELREASVKLDGLARRNAETLFHAHNATERLLDVVMNEIRKNVQKEAGYSGRGHFVSAEMGRTRPVAFNQRV